MSDKNLIQGAAILTTSIFISKILGIIYIFPFQAIVGLEGLALYHYGYTPYTLFISLSTLGIPIAISKFVSKYNTLGDDQTVQLLIRSGLVVMFVTGLIAFATLFLLAEPIARLIIDPHALEGNSIDDIVFTIRMVSTALLVIPVMSAIRGYFQGYGLMGPTAVSQVIEQIVRIIFILLFTYLIIEVWNGSLGTAVGFATFGAFVGAVGGLIVLLIYFSKRKGDLHTYKKTKENQPTISLPKMYKELISYALPISFVGLSIPLFQTVDLVTFNNALMHIGYSQNEAEMFFGAFGQAVHKLVLIPVSVATAMSITIIPTVTNAFINNDLARLKGQITQTFGVILFFSIPASIGLVLLSDVAYGTMYNIEDISIGGKILKYYAPVAILFSIFAVTSALLQGINRQKFAVIALIIGILFKAIFNYPFMLWFDVGGAVIATGMGYLLAIGINVWAIGKYASYDYHLILRRLSVIIVFTALMGVLVLITRNTLTWLLPLDSRFNSFIVLVTAALLGFIVYMFLSVKSGFAKKILNYKKTSTRSTT